MKHLLATASLVAMAACTGQGDYRSSFFSEAGSVVDSGSFGNANMNNVLVMTGEKGYVSDLANRFASEVPSTVNFAFDSAHLDAAARNTLNAQASWIKQFPEVRFRVYGHTDKVGSESYNRHLGQRRANAVVNYLTSHGISRSRLEAVVSYGETQPVVVTEGREPRNRRTVTEVTGFVASHPDIIEGRYASVIYRDYVASAKPPTDLSMVAGDEQIVGE
jgi:outer membrane protein OmpA-like peptidoglycan-associated protein